MLPSIDIRTLKQLKEKYSISYLAVFGSYVRNEQNEGSDLDLLVRFKNAISLLDFVRIEREISEEIGMKVDLVSPGALSPFIKKQILKEAKVIIDE